MEFGDVEAGFAEADRWFEDVFFYEGNTICRWSSTRRWRARGRGAVTVYSSTQTPHYLHAASPRCSASLVADPRRRDAQRRGFAARATPSATRSSPPRWR